MYTLLGFVESFLFVYLFLSPPMCTGQIGLELGYVSRGRPTSFFPSPSLSPAGICIRGKFSFLYLKWEEKVLETFSVFVFLGYIEKARGGTFIWSEELDLGPSKSKMVQRVIACSQQRTQ